jgi:hypothetical protein
MEPIRCTNHASRLRSVDLREDRHELSVTGDNFAVLTRIGVAAVDSGVPLVHCGKFNATISTRSALGPRRFTRVGVRKAAANTVFAFVFVANSCGAHYVPHLGVPDVKQVYEAARRRVLRHAVVSSRRMRLSRTRCVLSWRRGKRLTWYRLCRRITCVWSHRAHRCLCIRPDFRRPLQPAVTLGLVAGTRFDVKDALAYIVAQVAGAVIGAAIMFGTASGKSGWKKGGFASNRFGDSSPSGQPRSLSSTVNRGIPF